MNNFKFIVFIFLAFIISFILMITNTKADTYYGAVEAYRVYLDGESLGLIKSDQELNEFIDNEQQEIKDTYHVDKVYAPQGLEIKKEMTYSNLVQDTKDIYEKIKDKSSFTIEGYEILITKKDIESNTDKSGKKETYVEETVIYSLDDDIFKNAVATVVKSFVDEEQYQKFLENNQEKIIDTGVIIENVYIEDDFRIKKTLVPTDKVIFTDEVSLAGYLLFGTTEKQSTYTVQADDTIKKIADENKMSTTEFLIANPDIQDENALLYKGQKVVIGLINPKFVVIEEVYSVQNEEILYQTETRYNNRLYTGVVKVIRDGSYGESKVSKKIKYSNGVITDVRNISSEVIIEPVSRIIEKGARTTYIVGDAGIWKWPTKVPYTISSYQGWRASGFHYGIDITGIRGGSHNSPIYAAQGGTVEVAGWATSFGMSWTYGKIVIINHNNGYRTRYAHLNKVYVSVGEGVEMGDVIAGMGTTGRSSGTHLHFEAWYKGKLINPFDLYQ